MKRSLWDKFEAFPPITCRLLARTRTPGGGIRAMTSEEIAAASGMSLMEVNSLAWLPSWDNVPVIKVRQFSEACGVDLTDRAQLRGHSSYIRRGASWKYLKQSPLWDVYYKPMIAAYLQYRAR